MGWPEMAGKSTKLRVTHGGRCRRFASPIPARPAAVGGEILRPRSSGGGAPPCPAWYNSGGRKRLPRLKLNRPKNGLKRPNSGFSGFGDFLSGFWVGS